METEDASRWCCKAGLLLLHIPSECLLVLIDVNYKFTDLASTFTFSCFSSEAQVYVNLRAILT